MEDGDEAAQEQGSEYSDGQRQIIIDAVNAEGRKGGTWADKLAVAKVAGYKGGSSSALANFMAYHDKNKTGKQAPRVGPPPLHDDATRRAVHAAVKAETRGWAEKFAAAKKAGYRGASKDALYQFVRVIESQGNKTSAKKPTAVKAKIAIPPKTKKTPGRPVGSTKAKAAIKAPVKDARFNIPTPTAFGLDAATVTAWIGETYATFEVSAQKLVLRAGIDALENKAAIMRATLAEIEAK